MMNYLSRLRRAWLPGPRRRAPRLPWCLEALDDRIVPSNGTGTVLVKDINPAGDGLGPGSLVDVNGTLFFAANDGAGGTELWKSNGTAAGTALVKDVDPGGNGSYPSNLTNVNGTLF